jgi:hypothetical protein
MGANLNDDALVWSPTRNDEFLGVDPAVQIERLRNCLERYLKPDAGGLDPPLEFVAGLLVVDDRNSPRPVDAEA